MAHGIAASELIQGHALSGKAIDQTQFRHREAWRHDLGLGLDALRVDADFCEHRIKRMSLVRVRVLIDRCLEQSKVVVQLHQLPRYRRRLNRANEGQVPPADDVAGVGEDVNPSAMSARILATGQVMIWSP